MRNRTVGARTRTRHLAARPSRTPNPGLGLTVKVPFLFYFKRHFNILLIRLRASQTPQRPRPSYHVSCFGLTITFLILSLFLSLIFIDLSFIDVTLRYMVCSHSASPAALPLSYQTCTNAWSVRSLV